MILKNYDLNLLVALDALLAERSVTRAARRLDMTQSAASQALARARAVFDDELLIRAGHDMTLTDKGRALAPQVRAFCTQAESLFGPGTFDPSTAEINFKVAANDVSELLILPPLISAVAREAPLSRVLVRPVTPTIIDHTIDLSVIGTAVPQGPYSYRDLYVDTFAIIARPDHPAMGPDLTAETFAALPHALTSPTGEGLTGSIDHALEKLGLSRHIALSTTRFLALPQVIASTDIISAVPQRFADRPEVQACCRSWPLPFESPTVPMRLVWHKLRDADPVHKWLRELI